MLIVGTMWARGEGSTLRRKNAQKICGQPILYWALQNAIDAGFMDDIFVITEDREIAEVARSLSCHVIERPREMLYYNGGLASPAEWRKYVQAKKMKIIHKDPDVSVGLNCNICLLSGETLRKMYIRLMEDERAVAIHPVVEVEPHLHMINPETGYLFPVWEDQGLDRQQFPKLYRRIGIPIVHEKKAAESFQQKHMYHIISREEAIDIHSEFDLLIAEEILKQRLKNTVHHSRKQDSVRGGNTPLAVVKQPSKLSEEFEPKEHVLL